MAPAAGVLFGLFFVAMFGAMIAGIVFWVLKLIEVVRIPDQQFRAVGTDKSTWVIVVAVAQIVGALIWQFAKRAEVLGAAGRVPSPPPGWFPEPGSQALRWWDGSQWTEHRHVPPPG